MSKTIKPTRLDLFSQMEMVQLEAATLVTALVSCEAFNGASDIDRAAYLEMVVKKQAELSRATVTLRDSLREVWS